MPMKPHQTFPYNPMEHVSQARRDHLQLVARALFINTSRTGPLGGTYFTYTDFGDMLWEINSNSRFGNDDNEKAMVWTFIVWMMYDVKPDVHSQDLVAENFDKYHTGFEWGHILIAFTDGRHGTVGGEDSYTDGSWSDAEREILAYETFPGGLVNQGDRNASLNTVRTMFQFRAFGFLGFAREWNRVFLGR